MNPQLPTNVTNALNGGPSPDAMAAFTATGSPQPTTGTSPNLLPAQTPDRPFTTTLGDLLMSKGQLPPMVSPHATKIGDAVTQTISNNPQAAAQPGGVMRAVVAGGLSALQGAQAVGRNLGDVAAVGQVPSGGGALTGIARTLGARNQRQVAQKQQQFQNTQEASKNQVMMAEANARMIHEQRLWHNEGEAGVDAAVKTGQQQWEAMQGQAQPAQELETNLTDDQIKALIKTPNNPNGKYDIHDVTAIPMGKRVVREEGGLPVNQATYRLVTVPAVDLDPENPKQKATLDYLNEFAPPGNDPKKKWQGENGNPVHLEGPQFNMLYQHANDAAAAQMAKELNITRMGLNAREVEKSKETLQFLKDPAIINALARSSSNADIMSAYNQISQRTQTPNDPLYGKYPNIRNDFREWMGQETGKDGKPAGYIFDKMEEDYQKKLDDRLSIFKDEQKKVDEAHGEEAAALAETFKQKAETDTDPQMRKQYGIWSDRLNQTATASLAYESKKKTQEIELNNALAEGDTSTLVDAALNYQLDPNKLYSMRKNTNAEFKAAMLRKDPTWSEAVYKQRFNMQQELASDKTNSMGGQIESLNRFGNHLATANRGIQGLRNMSSPIINTPLNKIKAGVVGFPEAQAFKIEAETAKDEFLNFIKNGHVPPTEQEERLAAAINDGRTPAELQATFRAMAELVAGRAKAMNGRYNTIMGGGSIPGLLQPDTNNILKQFGVDVDAVTNPKERTSFSNDINKPLVNLPPAAVSQLKEGQNTTFKNGQTWTLQGGTPVQVNASGK